MTDLDDYILPTNYELPLCRRNNSARMEVNRHKELVSQRAASEYEALPGRIRSLTDGRKIRGAAFYWMDRSTIALGKTSLKIQEFHFYPNCYSGALISDGNPAGSRRTFRFTPTLKGDRIVWSLFCSHIDRNDLFSTAKVARFLVEQLASVHQPSLVRS
jgi:hypothetical protein